MVLFFTGLIVGAIASVVADRLWRRYEQHLRLDISFGEFFNTQTGQLCKGYQFTITNRGKYEIPPYKIWICNPFRGSISLFDRDRNQSTLPEQQLVHKCFMIINKELSAYLPDFFQRTNGGIMNEAQKSEFVFRLVLDNSEKIIYENKSLGNAFVKIFQNTRSNMNFEKNSYNDMMALQVKYEPIYKKVFSYNWRRICKRKNNLC
jgi:hypothetical protein